MPDLDSRIRAAGFDVVGLVGRDIERTKRRADANGVAKFFIDLDDAITQTGAKVVAIATPPHTHGPLSLLAISRGCHVLCEKPFARDVSEARAMLDAAERAGVIHLVGHEFRWQPDRAILARAIADGLIGKPRFMTLLQCIPFANPETKMPRWWFDVDAGGGWLGASGSHLVDQVRATVGEFASVSASLPMVSAREAVAENSYVLRFSLTNGVEGIMQQTAGAWGPSANMTRIAGTDGTAWVENGVVKIADRNGTRDLPLPADLELPPPPLPSEDPRKQFSTLELGPYTRLCEVLFAAMEGKPLSAAVAVPTFADGVASMEVLDAIRRSAANHGELVELG